MVYHARRHGGKSKRGLYGDVVGVLDWSVGEVLDKLRESYLDKTKFYRTIPRPLHNERKLIKNALIKKN